MPPSVRDFYIPEHGCSRILIVLLLVASPIAPVADAPIELVVAGDPLVLNPTATS